MKPFYKQSWFYLMLIAIINFLFLIVILITMLKLHNINFYKIFVSELFLSIVGMATTIVISIVTHRQILNRDKRINTISEFSKIREKYSDLSTPEKANCENDVPLNEKRLAYLKQMEFFCIGIQEKVFDMKIVERMSGRLLKKQYCSYMRDFALSRVKKGFEYKEYFEIMDKLCENYKYEE